MFACANTPSAVWSPEEEATGNLGVFGSKPLCVLRVTVTNDARHALALTARAHFANGDSKFALRLLNWALQKRKTGN